MKIRSFIATRNRYFKYAIAAERELPTDYQLYYEYSMWCIATLGQIKPRKWYWKQKTGRIRHYYFRNDADRTWFIMRFT